MTPTPEFTITRTFDAPRELLWRAWTDPDEASHWLHPRGVETPRERVRMDVREGGGYEYVMIVPGGEEYPTCGTFLELVEPERIVLTWGSPDQADADRPVITVSLAELPGDRTEMTFHLVGFGVDHTEHSVYDGWSEALDVLAEWLPARQAS